MVFNNLKETLRTRRGRHQHTQSHPNVPIPQINQPDEKTERAEKLAETMKVFNRLGHSISSRHIRLPPIPSFKPLNFSNMDLFKSRNFSVETVPADIRRKPCPIPESRHGDLAGVSSDVLYTNFRAFDPGAPVTDPTLNARARQALKSRYESKFTIDFEPPPGVDVRDYDFIWCDAGELDLKVLQDIVWVRERFLQAKKGEPTDEDIIEWYDAGRFDPEVQASPRKSCSSYWL